MSNPGVITLMEKEISASKSFRVEDNLGESIHFHYNDIRIDLTIPELLYIADVCDDTIYELVKADHFNLDDYDGNFLNTYSQYLMDLEQVVTDTVSLRDFYVQCKGLFHLPVRRRLNATRAKKILARPKKEISRYEITSGETVYQPVLFNNNNTLMYGEEDVAKLYLEHPDQQISVLRMKFENEKHSISKHPWIPFLFKWDKKRLIRVAKKAAMRVLN